MCFSSLPFFFVSNSKHAFVRSFVCSLLLPAVPIDDMCARLKFKCKQIYMKETRTSTYAREWWDVLDASKSSRSVGKLHKDKQNETKQKNERKKKL